MKNSILLESITRDELFSEMKNIMSQLIDSKLHPEVQQLKYNTKKEVQAILRCSLRKVTRMTNDGTLKGYRFGRNILYKNDEINQVLKEIQTLKYKRN